MDAEITKTDIHNAFNHYYSQDTRDQIFRLLLQARRWPNGVECPFCEYRKIYTIENGNRFKCSSCGKKFSATSGTVFANTKLDLCCLFATLNEVLYGTDNSCELARSVYVTQKTSWWFAKKVKPHIRDGTFYFIPTKDG